MEGYYISKQKAIELGLLEKSEIVNELQNVIIAITETDIIEYQNNSTNNLRTFSDKEKIEIANWFYSEYYDSFMESILNYGKN